MTDSIEKWCGAKVDEEGNPTTMGVLSTAQRRALDPETPPEELRNHILFLVNIMELQERIDKAKTELIADLKEELGIDGD